LVQGTLVSRLRGKAVALVALTSCLSLEAQHNPIRSFLPSQREIWSAPRKMERKHWTWLMLAGAGTAALIAADRKITNGMPNTNSQFMWATRSSRLGGAAGLAIFSGSAWAAGALGHNTRWKAAGAASSEALMHSLVVTYALKATFARQRPDTGAEAGQFWSAGTIRTMKSDNSFPSGHSMGSWAVATAFSRQFPDKKYVPWLAYGFASAMSISRVAAHKHYASDVAVGAGLGYLIGRMVGNRHHAETLRKQGWLRKPDVDVDLRPASKTVGLRLRWTAP
jgi:membrane-associated phospholipid phosphatase